FQVPVASVHMAVRPFQKHVARYQTATVTVHTSGVSVGILADVMFHVSIVHSEAHLEILHIAKQWYIFDTRVRTAHIPYPHVLPSLDLIGSDRMKRKHLLRRLLHDNPAMRCH